MKLQRTTGSGRVRLLLALMLVGTLASPVIGQPKLRKTLKGHTNHVNSVAFSPDSKTLASFGNGTIKLWYMATVKKN